MGPLLSISGLSKAIPPHAGTGRQRCFLQPVLREILALLGPSGCGKTTTLRMLAGFETPDTGSIRLKDRDITSLSPQKRHIGMVFQDYALFPHMTLAENVTFAMQHIARDQRYAKALEWLELVGLGELADRFPEELSGGQQQRVALVRTLAAEPELVLLDEPFSNLDAGLRERTRKEMRRLFKETGTSVVLVTHDQAEAMTMADRIGVMKDGDLLQLGPPQQVYREPANAFVAEFLGHTNLLEAQASGESAQTPLGQVDLNAPAEGRVTLSLRPEHLALVPADDSDSDSATVVDREFRGTTISTSCSGAGSAIAPSSPTTSRLKSATACTSRRTSGPRCCPPSNSGSTDLSLPR